MIFFLPAAFLSKAANKSFSDSESFKSLFWFFLFALISSIISRNLMYFSSNKSLSNNEEILYSSLSLFSDSSSFWLLFKSSLSIVKSHSITISLILSLLFSLRLKFELLIEFTTLFSCVWSSIRFKLLIELIILLISLSSNVLFAFAIIFFCKFSKEE